ncbi:MAG TPA: hypothetical protein VMS37_33745, partial [Verrucomicrobiae bacterium]|nr:hypothetical protein [Verrucomicrobiae bacterium]
EENALPAASEALAFMLRISRAAQVFSQQSAKERRELLQLVLEEASWKRKKLRMLLHGPFEDLRLSNSATIRVSWDFDAKAVNFDNWRRERDSNPR